MIRIKILTMFIVILSNFNISCSTLNGHEPKKPKNIPDMAIWHSELNNWGYKEKTGRAMFWYPNGQMAQSTWLIDNKHEGYYTAWYENGNKEMEGMHRNDQQIGLWKWWWPNGNTKMKGSFVDGQEEGTWEVYDENENGKKIGELYFKNGVKISEIDLTKK